MCDRYHSKSACDNLQSTALFDDRLPNNKIEANREGRIEQCQMDPGLPRNQITFSFDYSNLPPLLGASFRSSSKALKYIKGSQLWMSKH